MCELRVPCMHPIFCRRGLPWKDGANVVFLNFLPGSAEPWGWDISGHHMSGLQDGSRSTSVRGWASSLVCPCPVMMGAKSPGMSWAGRRVRGRAGGSCPSTSSEPHPARPFCHLVLMSPWVKGLLSPWGLSLYSTRTDPGEFQGAPRPHPLPQSGVSGRGGCRQDMRGPER